MEQKYIYPVLLSTPYRTGKFIRVMTGYEYNHIGISLTSDIKHIHSFARRHKAAPFYGGFVYESVLRYKLGGKIARVKIFKIPVNEEKFDALSKELADFRKNSEKYIYNFASALAVPFKRPVKIPGAYTCVEFAIDILKKYTELSVLNGKRFWSIKEIDEALSPYLVYEGSAKPFLSGGSWEGDTFSNKISRRKTVTKTAGSLWELGKRYVSK